MASRSQRADLRRMRQEMEAWRNASRMLINPGDVSKALNELDRLKEEYEQYKESILQSAEAERERAKAAKEAEADIRDARQKEQKATQAAMSAQAKAVQAFSNVFDSMAKVATGAFIGISASMGGITAAVNLFNPAIAQRFTWELRNLGAAFGRILQPVIESATQFVIRLNQAITNLSPSTKRLLATVSALGASFIMARSAVGMLMPVVAAFGALMSAVITTILAKGAALNVTLAGIPAIVGAIVTLFGALATGAVTLGVYGEAFGDMGTGLQGIQEISKSLKELFGALKPIFAEMMKGLASFAPIFVAGTKIIIFGVKAMIVAFGLLGIAVAGVAELFSRAFGGEGGQVAAAVNRMRAMLGMGQQTGGGGARTFAAGSASWEQVDEAGRRAVTAALSMGAVSEQQQMIAQLQDISGTNRNIMTHTEDISRDVANAMEGRVRERLRGAAVGAVDPFGIGQWAQQQWRGAVGG